MENVIWLDGLGKGEASFELDKVSSVGSTYILIHIFSTMRITKRYEAPQVDEGREVTRVEFIPIERKNQRMTNLERHPF